MQERSKAERRAIWPCLNLATWRRERSDRAIQQMLIATKYNHMKIIADIEFFRRIE